MHDATTVEQERIVRPLLHGHDDVAATASEEFVARPFGTNLEDLDVEFPDRPRPVVLTHVFGNCLRSAGMGRFSEADLWGWSVARRLQALLVIVAATGGTHRQVTAACAAPDCRQTMEIDLDLTMFRRVCADAVLRFSPAPGIELTMRLPTGHDQLRFGQNLWTEPLLLARELIAADGHSAFQPQWLPRLESVLEEHDPLTTLQLVARCPYCGNENRLDFDLEGFLLGGLERHQTILLDAIHRLACVYHWSERDIVALPPHRRTHYLDRMDRETLA